MANLPSQGDDLDTCPSCHNPVEPGHKFCQICGTPIEQHPVCRSCGTAYIVPVKFCEVCGSPMDVPGNDKETSGLYDEPPSEADVDGEEEPAEDVSPQEPAAPSAQSRPAKQREPAASGKDPLPERPVRPPVKDGLPRVDDVLMMIPDEPPTIPGRDDSAVNRQAAATTRGAEQNRSLIPEPKKPARQPVRMPANLPWIAGGIIVLLVIAAGGYFVGLPLMRDGFSLPAPVAVTAPPAETPVAVQTQEPAMPSTPAPVQETAPVTPPVPTATVDPLATLPTQVLPKGQELIFQIQKDPVTSAVTVIFAGGPGINALYSADVRVTHGDGSIVTGTIKPSLGVTEITLEGSRDGDRVEIIANMHNGQTYRIIDEIYSYKARA